MAPPRAVATGRGEIRRSVTAEIRRDERELDPQAVKVLSLDELANPAVRAGCLRRPTDRRAHPTSPSGCSGPRRTPRGTWTAARRSGCARGAGRGGGERWLNHEPGAGEPSALRRPR